MLSLQLLTHDNQLFLFFQYQKDQKLLLFLTFIPSKVFYYF